MFNAIISCLVLVIICGLKNKRPTQAKIAFAGLVSFILTAIVLCGGTNWGGLYLIYKYLIEALPFLAVIPLTNVGVILLMPNPGSGSGSILHPTATPCTSLSIAQHSIAELDQRFGAIDKNDLRALIDKVKLQKDYCNSPKKPPLSLDTAEYPINSGLGLHGGDHKIVARTLLGLRKD